MKKSIDLSLATRLMNHGPVVLVSSVLDGKVNVTPVAWNMPIKKNPPLVALEIGENHHIYTCIMETGDFVVNIPPASIVSDVVRCGTVSGRDVNKVELCGFKLTDSEEVSSPGIACALATLECSLVRDNHLLERYNIVLGEVKFASVENGVFDDHWLFDRIEQRTLHHLGNKTFCVPEGKIIDLR